MATAHYRSVVVDAGGGAWHFFDYMDVAHALVARGAGTDLGGHREG